MRYLVVLLLLAGCVTAEEQARRDWIQNQARQTEHRNQVMGQCTSYGFQPGTKEFQNCYMQVDMALRQQNEAQRQMLLQQYILQQGIFRK